jgi:hypothetical protein
MKHNILWGIILLVASLSFTAKAQKAVQGQFSVKGVLLDSLSNEGEPYSTIRISLKNNPVKPVKLAVTGADGRFDERLAVPGTYLIHFTSVGKSPVQKEFSISANRRNVDLGKIPFIIPNTHPDSSSTSTTDITLHNMTMCISL